MGARPGAPVLVVGGGIGGMAAALALSQSGFAVELFEQSAEIGEIGAGLQLGPNGFAAMDALGVGERARQRAVYTDDLVMMDAIDGSEIARIPVGEAFRRRFNNPYAVIHRADIHRSVYEEVELVPGIRVHTSARIARVDFDDQGVRLTDAAGRHPRRRGGRGLRRRAFRRPRSASSATDTASRGTSSIARSCRAPTCRPTCAGTRPRSGSARIAISSTIRCAAASNTTSS